MKYYDRIRFERTLNRLKKTLSIFKNDKLSEFIISVAGGDESTPNLYLDFFAFYLPIYYPKLIISEKDENTLYVRVKIEEIWNRVSKDEKVFNKEVGFDLFKHPLMKSLMEKYKIKNDLTENKTKYYSLVIKKNDIPKEISIPTYCESKVVDFLLFKFFPEEHLKAQQK